MLRERLAKRFCQRTFWRVYYETVVIITFERELDTQLSTKSQ
jgi:hypothetical protein